jgi:hypothetical protein
MCYLKLKFAILENYPSQADFAFAVNQRESKISRVLHGRQKLTPEEANIWKNHLSCESSILEAVTINNEEG